MLSKLSTEEWRLIAERYPYFGAAQMLYTKALQQSGDHRFSDQLHQTAVYSGNRRILYDWVKTNTHKEEENLQTGAQEHTPIVTSEAASLPTVATEAQYPVEDIIVEENHENESSSTTLAHLILEDEEPISKSAISDLVPQEQKEVLVEISIQSENPEVATIVESENSLELSEEPKGEEPDSPVIHARDLDPMEQSILIEAVQSSIETEVSEATEMPSSISEPEENDNSYAAFILRRSRRVHFGDDAPASIPEISSEESVNDWIRDKKVVISADQEEIERELEEEQPAPQAGQSLSHGMRKIQVNDQKSHQKDLIDRFIRLDPNIARGKAADYSAGNIAKESLEEDYSFVTETMAQLFAKQGKTDKARKAFRKLIELYPEKSVYFAAQLKNLEKLKK
jgi:tetratricopeptide (TPR) repeat protein